MFWAKKQLLNFASSLIPKGGKKCTFHLSSFKRAHFDQKWLPDIWGVPSKKLFLNALYVEWESSTLVEHDKTLTYKGLTVIWIFMTPSLNTHNLSYIWSIHRRFLLWNPQKSGYHFWSKWKLSKLDKGKVHFLPPLGIENNTKFNITFVIKISVVFFSMKQYLYLQHSCNG